MVSEHEGTFELRRQMRGDVRSSVSLHCDTNYDITKIMWDSPSLIQSKSKDLDLMMQTIFREEIVKTNVLGLCISLQVNSVAT
ncbi:Oidioi.mRNA.OKI2018_I69.PAR.g8882.t1.cds [Oikopleura dioica]|uniref:Oidioi.mRNA.OKI2018_I69.PAR.g8882.t1.cds n=1 Tax=Oikopleura dioica TaxID=34765 RepID=A0ABN7RJ56_OIKDI|nr:Oidioi.mRNA.OKI2018_I69.PAR.g8882.t1.cds [Oikopleura dioica]